MESWSHHGANRQRDCTAVDRFRVGTVQYADGIARDLDKHELRQCRARWIRCNRCSLVRCPFEEV